MGKTKDKTSQPPQPPPPTAPSPTAAPPDVIVPPPPPDLNETTESPISSEIAKSIKTALDDNPIGLLAEPTPTPRREPTPEEIAEELAYQRPRMEAEIVHAPIEFITLSIEIMKNELARRGHVAPEAPGLREAVQRLLAAIPKDPLSFASTCTAAKLNEYHAAVKALNDVLS